VSVVKGVNAKESIDKAVAYIGGLKNLVKKGDWVIIKPDLVAEYLPYSGVTTKPEIVEVLTRLSQEAGARRITVAESAGVGSNTRVAFKNAGIDKVAQNLGVELLDLEDDQHIPVKVPNYIANEQLSISKSLLECNFLISIGVLKTHMDAGMTGSIKNIFAAITNKAKRRRHDIDILEEKLVDIVSTRKPDLNIEDGIIGQEGIASGGVGWKKPVNMNLVVVGRDPVAVDATSARIMGYDPCRISHLAWAAERRLGTYKDNEIEIIGERLEDVSRRFVRPYEEMTVDRTKLRIVAENACSGCWTKAMRVAWRDTDERMIENINIYIGPDAFPPVGQKNLILGDCLKGYSDRGTFVPGCPVKRGKVQDAYWKLKLS